MAMGRHDIRALRILVKARELDKVLNHRDNGGRTPVSYAVHVGSPAALEVLLPLKPDLTIKKKNGDQALHAACALNRTDLALLLAKAGACQRTLSAQGYSPLHIAALKGNSSMVQLLWAALPRGQRVFELDQKGETPTFAAVRRGDVGLFRQLAHLQHEPDRVNECGETLLYIAVDEGRKEVVEAILSLPVHLRGDINKVLDIKRRTLIEGFLAGDAGEVKPPPLGDSPQHENAVVTKTYSESALMRAVSLNHTEIVVALLKAGAQANVPNSDGRTALMFAILYGWPAMVPLLLDSAASVVQEDAQGFTSIVLAIKTLDEEMVSAIIARSPNLNTPDDHEGTPLHYAVRRSNLGIIKRLLAKGAVPECVNARGVSSRLLAVNMGAVDISMFFAKREEAKNKRMARKRLSAAVDSE